MRGQLHRSVLPVDEKGVLVSRVYRRPVHNPFFGTSRPLSTVVRTQESDRSLAARSIAYPFLYRGCALPRFGGLRRTASRAIPREIRLRPCRTSNPARLLSPVGPADLTVAAGFSGFLTGCGVVSSQAFSPRRWYGCASVVAITARASIKSVFPCGSGPSVAPLVSASLAGRSLR